ncbi:hypothetical protein Nmel_016368, partial [Mimus melanotis]
MQRLAVLLLAQKNELHENIFIAHAS